MTDPDLTPEQETRVRALLQDARYDEQVPDDVASRLDRVLAGLGVDPQTDELAVRRRRRGAGLLAAAACLVVGGVALGQVVSGSPGDDDGADSAGGEATSEIAAESAPSQSSADAQDQTRAGVGAEAPAPLPITDTPLEVSQDDFAKDAAAISRNQSLELFAGYDADSGGARDSATPLAASGAAWFTCAPAGWGAGDLVAVEYDGEPAVLAFRPPAGDTRVVEVLECGSASVLRSVTLPHP